MRCRSRYPDHSGRNIVSPQRRHSLWCPTPRRGCPMDERATLRWPPKSRPWLLRGSGPYCGDVPPVRRISRRIARPSRRAIRRALRPWRRSWRRSVRRMRRSWRRSVRPMRRSWRRSVPVCGPAAGAAGGVACAVCGPAGGATGWAACASASETVSTVGTARLSAASPRRESALRRDINSDSSLMSNSRISTPHARILYMNIHWMPGHLSRGEAAGLIVGASQHAWIGLTTLIFGYGRILRTSPRAGCSGRSRAARCGWAGCAFHKLSTLEPIALSRLCPTRSARLR